MEPSSLGRRDFIKLTMGAAGAAATGGTALAAAARGAPASQAPAPARTYNGVYEGERLDHLAFPLGGMGAGMICLEGRGSLSHVSLRHRPDIFNEPGVFSAIAIRGATPVARVLEGPVPRHRFFGVRGAGNGLKEKTYGLPRMQQAQFRARFPFGEVTLANDPDLPLDVHLTGWSPFVPGVPDDASLPVAALEYRFTNRSAAPVEAVYSFNAKNFMPPRAIRGGPAPAAKQSIAAIPGGFVLFAGAADHDRDDASFAAVVDDPAVKVNHAWFRGEWFDPMTMAWRDIAAGACVERPPITDGAPSPGASLFVPFQLAPGASRTIVVRFAWYAAHSEVRFGAEPSGAAAPKDTYQPWYTSRFKDVREVVNFWAENYARLRTESDRFSHCFHDSTLPPEVIEAVAANLTILKSPTCLRQADGRFWGWEGCRDEAGCCAGSCTHVWNYAQALPHLFPSLERSMRETEFLVSQAADGNQPFRASLPIRPARPGIPAADGQLGGLMKVYRDWRVSGDETWLRRLWPRVRASMDFCINQWDPGHKGWVEEPHHNTYDIEFWGPDGMCTSFYVGALHAAVAMGRALGEDTALYAELLAKGVGRLEQDLFDGEYFIQRVQWKRLRAKDPQTAASLTPGSYSAPEARELLAREGPKYQYGTGCLSDGILGAWLALVCGVGQVVDAKKVTSHLRAVHHHNLKRDLSNHANPQRPGYALGSEGGLLLCTWPKGGEPSLPFVYSNEVWTGIEYQVASHLMLLGLVEEGLEIVRVCRDRYDGTARNPFDEYECGHWYARAMSSYALLQGLSGARYDAVDKVLYLTPSVRGDFRCFLATATGYGTVGVRDGQPFLEVKSGTIDARRIDYTARA